MGKPFLDSDITRVTNAFAYIRDRIDDMKSYYTATSMAENALHAAAIKALTGERLRLKDYNYIDYTPGAAFISEYECMCFVPVLEESQKAFYRLCSTAAKSALPSNSMTEALYEIQSKLEPELASDRVQWMNELWEGVRWQEKQSEKGNGGHDEVSLEVSVAALFERHERARLS